VAASVSEFQTCSAGSDEKDGASQVGNNDRDCRVFGTAWNESWIDWISEGLETWYRERAAQTIGVPSDRRVAAHIGLKG
jgi:hypothetical protein